ncbi:taurine dioxygenase [Silvimonas terrae]|uniref:Taurine dioxygenase n=1 Tax=Silvimonas terrae TaxID=300266 RepID=A0A840RES8_9NEIS|nr:TauD/TfdA family dioxygenase [Silvimonas terrae]MBB5190761.1 taurine dioxygenase [Silvimonas terrae]
MSLITAPSGITIRQLAGHIGAEIGNVNLADKLSDAVVYDIRQALLKWKVVFFRNQQIGHAEQVIFTSRFGKVTYAHPYEDEPVAEHPQILPVDRFRQQHCQGLRWAEYEKRWHTDVTAAVNPPAATVLRAVDVPPYGGDTQWTNLVAAYEGLSAPVRALADVLKAEHRFAANQRLPEDSKLQQRFIEQPLVAIHPVVRVHPETGERALFVNPGFTSHIVDVSAAESDRILGLFFEQIARPAYTVRFHWHNGDVAFWDNRATANLSPQDLDHLNVARVLYRTTLVGDIPVGVDGFHSELVKGEFFGTNVPTALELARKIMANRSQT